MTLMYDATTAANIPAHAEIVAGYINGPRSKWKQSDWDRFPNAVKVRILVYIPGMAMVPDGDVLDVETQYVSTPDKAASRRAVDYADQWVRIRTMNGVRPTLYTSKEGLKYLGYLHTLADFWIADPTGIPHLLPGTVATQFAWKGPYDVSITVDGWPRTLTKGTTAMPIPNAPCVAFRCTPTGKGYWMVGADGGVFAFGDAGFFGSLGDKKLNYPISGMEVTPSGLGYWLFSSPDYGVFAFGDAEYLGHPGA